MGNDKQLETLEGEFKLLKGELKQTLASVRDYLVTSEIPASEYATIMAAIGGGTAQTMQMQGSIAMPKKPRPVEETEEEEEEELVEKLPPEEDMMSELAPSEETVGESAPGEETVSESAPGEETVSESAPDEEMVSELAPDEEMVSELAPDEELVSESAPDEEMVSELAPGEEMVDELLPGEEPVEPEELFMPESELSEPQEELEKSKAGASQSVPGVNLLANLIRWVANAKREIGSEQLPVFLEVYGISGHLSMELKEVLLRLADITSEQPVEASAADIWSRSILELHGVLAGSDAPIHPVKPFWKDDGDEMQLDETEAEAEAEPETDGIKEKLVKLKLVFSNGDGPEKEFSIDLNPENGQESS